MCIGKYQLSFDSKEDFNNETCCDVFIDSIEEAWMYVNFFEDIKEKNPTGINFDPEMNYFLFLSLPFSSLPFYFFKCACY